MSSSAPEASTPTCSEKFGNQVEGFISRQFFALGLWVGANPRKTILLSIVVTVLCGGGFTQWTTENRADKLWVPQNTIAEAETAMYQSHFQSTSRFNSLIVEASSGSVLEKTVLIEAMKMHLAIETEMVTIEDEGLEGEYDLLALCTKTGGSCASKFDGVCQCLVSSILRQWNYDLETLQNDQDVLATINAYGSRDDLDALLGNPVFDEATGAVLSAGGFTVAYFLQNRQVADATTETDPINEGWEKDAFLWVAESASEKYPLLSVKYLAGRSFSDEFGTAITGDLALVQISYVVVFLYLGANMGNIKCGAGSRWTMSLGALVMVLLSTAAGFGFSALCGLFFGPVHSLLPFILLGIGVDDAFVIVNAFNRERKVARARETNEDLTKRSARGLARAGASITVTSLTDFVAFAISSQSSLPALASFCAYAAICVFFLWVFAATFFTATLVLDERRQRDNRRECLCCLTRKNVPTEEESDEGDVFVEDSVSRFFRNYHAPAILSSAGKLIVTIVFAGLFGFGLWGALNLSVEDTERAFIPAGSYLNDYLNSADKLYPDAGINVNIVFEGSADIYKSRQALAELDTRLKGLSTVSPFIAEPVSDEVYKNVMAGMSKYLSTSAGNATLGADGWPTTEAEFVQALASFTSFTGPGAMYAQDIDFSEDLTQVEAIRIHAEYVRLTKKSGKDVIDDAEKQIGAMDDTRELINSWDDLPEAFPFSDKFITIEGFKSIKKELFLNVGLAIVCVGVIVFLTVASPMTSFLVTINVTFCIVEILGFMHALGIAIDSVSVINIVLAVGLSIDYSAHVGHCFMHKGGQDKDARVLEALADIGASVFNGAATTFLAVVVLLFSNSYVFQTLSVQFALTVGLGIAHGLILLPVLLALFGPKPFSSAEAHSADTSAISGKDDKPMAKTSHSDDQSISIDEA